MLITNEKREIGKMQKLTKKELIALIDVLIKQNEELKKQIANLKKDSSTSSKPPSSDINKFAKNQSLRKKTGRKPGGQKGQKRIGISQTKTPDTTIRCEASHCENCGKLLKNSPGLIKSRRQEKDIPPIETIITEYQQIQKQCSCGHCNLGKFPEHITAPTQIGKNAKALITYLNTAHLLPYKRLTTISNDLFGFPISEGTIDNFLQSAGKKALPIHKQIIKMIKAGKWIGSDETGMRVDKKTNWLWVWQSPLGAYYAIEKGRGYGVIEKHFKENYKGVLVHDCWSAQNNTKAKKGHQQCHPHLQRFLEFLIKTYRSKWAYNLRSLLLASQKARDQIWREGFDAELRKRVIGQYEQKLEKFIQISLSEKEAITLQKRIKKHKSEIFFFMQDSHIPFHNNDSEKAIRQAKVKQKISGCFRSRRGADRYACLLSGRCKYFCVNWVDILKRHVFII